MNWDYLQPVKIHFGKGRVKEIKEIARELGCGESTVRMRLTRARRYAKEQMQQKEGVSP